MEEEELEYMDEDTSAIAGKRRHRSPDKTKVRGVPGPQRQELDNVREWEAYHKDQVIAARHKSRELTAENQVLHAQLAAQLEAAEKLQAEHFAHLSSLHEELDSKTRAIEELQKHEGQMEAQFLGDQQKLEALLNERNMVFPQLVESQKLLMQRNQEVDMVKRLLDRKTDELLQLRSSTYARAKKAPHTPPPRRGTRASLDPVRNSGTRTIEIPLDPIPIPATPRRESNPKPKAAQQLSATPAFANLLGTDVETLAGVMDQLKLLLQGDGVTLKIKKTTPKKGKSQAATSQKPENRDLKNYINKLLRDTTYAKFGVTQAADFQIYNPAEPDDVTACEDEIADPADDLFRWDFSPGYIQSRWNELMIAKIVDAALAEDGEDGPIAESGIERDSLEAMMVDKLSRYRAGWKDFQPRFNDGLGRMETKREARERGTHKFEQHQLGSRSNSSKKRKLEVRVETIKATIEIKTSEGKARDVAAWERLLGVAEHLTEQGMSSEEEDEIEVEGSKVLVYRVKLCVWREPRVADYLRLVDAQTAVFRKHQAGPEPAPRLKSHVRGSSNAPCGLPKSLYNAEWLKKVPPAYLKELNVSKEAFELLVAATDRMVV
ncbi:hypothetical protein C8R47DRAFT_1222096 [Mycena vitilis]|nr:hypothetical protein C8R47DRAFT_1222096 [Mycena vitilis]